MNKQEIFAHYSAIIDDLINRSMYFSTYFQNPFYLESNIYGCDYEELPSNIDICDGATRACIIDENYDYVVKFDINEDNYGSACEREEQIYRNAVAYALERYFNEIVYIGSYTRTIEFYPFYQIEQNCDFYGYNENDFDEEIMAHEDEMTIMPIVISIPLYACRRAEEYDCGPVSNELMVQAQKIVSPLRNRNICVATAFIKNYGMDEYEALSEFALENEINDLHTGNIGEVDGLLILTDYGGYHDGENDEYGIWD